MKAVIVPYSSVSNQSIFRKWKTWFLKENDKLSSSPSGDLIGFADEEYVLTLKKDLPLMSLWDIKKELEIDNDIWPN